MKKLIELICILIASVLIVPACTDAGEETAEPLPTRAATQTETAYYWYDGHRIPLRVDADKKFVLVDAADAMPVSPLSTDASSEQTLRDVALSPSIVRLTQTRAAAPERHLKWTVVSGAQTRAAANADVVYEAPYYRTAEGCEIGLSHLFYVKLKNKSDETALLQLASDNGVEVIGYNEFMPEWYTLSCTTESAGHALEMANLFYETGRFAAAEPSFIESYATAAAPPPNDIYFNSQWGLRNLGGTNGVKDIDINYLDILNHIPDNGVVIAVIDSGVDLTHSDLNVLPAASTYDAETGTVPSRIYSSHGTECAGIICAHVGNRIGIAGIASACPVLSLSVNLNMNLDKSQKLADCFNVAVRKSASVISNSWFGGTCSSIINDAIRNALTNGRNGLGCVVVFASGNDGLSRINPAASAFEDIIVVGAIDRTGKRAVFNNKESSCYGTGLDVVAPGMQIVTTTYYSGQTSDNYTFNFLGTSAACPHVAALAGVILSMNGKLTQKRVGEIINETAQKIRGYHYQNWEPIRPTIVYHSSAPFSLGYDPTGQTKAWHEEVGYGLIDMHSALRLAWPGIYVKPIKP